MRARVEAGTGRRDGSGRASGAVLNDGRRVEHPRLVERVGRKYRECV